MIDACLTAKSRRAREPPIRPPWKISGIRSVTLHVTRESCCRRKSPDRFALSSGYANLQDSKARSGRSLSGNAAVMRMTLLSGLRNDAEGMFEGECVDDLSQLVLGINAITKVDQTVAQVARKNVSRGVHDAFADCVHVAKINTLGV